MNAHGTPPATRPLMAIVAGFAGLYSALGLVRHWHFGSGYDLAIFDQAVWHMSRFEAPASTISGYTNILGDHFYPILALFAPLYWIAPSPETLIVAQAVLLAVSIIPMCWFARARCPSGPRWVCASHTVCSGACSAPPSPTYTKWRSRRSSSRRRSGRSTAGAGGCCGSNALLLLVKEDLIPLAGAFGAFLIFRGERRQGALMIATAGILFVAVLWIVIPWFDNGAGWSTGGAFREVWERPWAAPAMLVSPPGKLRTMLIWLAPFAFLPLRSPYALLLIPVALARLLSSSPTHWGAAAHYSAPLAPILVMRASDGLARMTRNATRPETRSRVITSFVAATLLIAAIVPGHQPHWRAFRPDYYRNRPSQTTGAAAFAVIPPTASLVAQATLAPHLSQRELIYVLKPGAPDADYVIAAADLDPWPMARDELAALMQERRQRGYVPVFEEGGWIVLRRPAADPGPRVP